MEYWNWFLRTIGLNSEFKEKSVIAGDNAVWRAVRENRLKTLKDLLARGAIDSNHIAVPKSDHTLLHESITMNKYEIFKLCLLYKADLNLRDSTGMTPLHKAASLGRFKMVEDLLEAGANKLLKDWEGKTALERAEFYDEFEIIEILDPK